MPDMETLFEQAFTSIQLGETGQHLLEAEAVTTCVVKGDQVTITLALPADDGLRSRVTREVESRVKEIPGIQGVTLQVTEPGGHNHSHAGGHHHPPEGTQPRAAQRPERQVYLDNYKAVIAVASGKGGVGKSTVAVNLAVTLAGMGHKVSLFDADIYGPSVPIMTGLREARPEINGNKIVPIQKFGLDILSLGNLVDESQAAIWRGPMVHQVLDQLLRDTQWPGGDFMILDLPPGTGDVQLTLSQLCEVSGALIVTTPQDVALLDAIRAVAMFQKVEIPILGLVENMSSFVCPHCDHETAIFNSGTGEAACKDLNVPFLGRLPLELSIRQGGDAGEPVSAAKGDSPVKNGFRGVAENMIKALDKL
ncbi:MAG: P-loop NTPase [Deltaproteobacteria bacterium]|nr:P-loop NTPase [Deltaproteobacteria bacterium]